MLTPCLASSLEIKFHEHDRKKELTRDAQNLFKFILPEAEVLNLRIEKIEDKDTAAMTVLLDRKIEDGFVIMRQVPPVNSYTYLVAWLLQGHFFFLKEQAVSPRHKRHLKLLSRYFKGNHLDCADTFYLGRPVEVLFRPDAPAVRGMDIILSASDKILYSGVPSKCGFAKIMLEGYMTKYIAVLREPENNRTVSTQ